VWKVSEDMMIQRVEDVVLKMWKRRCKVVIGIKDVKIPDSGGGAQSILIHVEVEISWL
jgi:hypothetical protein